MSGRSYRCASCNTLHMVWLPRCRSCAARASLMATDTPNAPSRAMPPPPSEPAPPQRPAPPSSTDPEPVPLSDVPAEMFVRHLSGVQPVDDVLGGGMVVGSVIVLGGPPGAGKSSLMLQVAAGSHLRTLYATGEETVAAVAERAQRLNVAVDRVLVVAERRCDVVIRIAKAKQIQLLMIDSVHKLVCEGVPGAAATPAQLKASCDMVSQYAKEHDVTVIMNGHVTRDDVIAGPRTLEHDVDVALMLETNRTKIDGEPIRILRCAGIKNRGGPSNKIGRFAMTKQGLVPLPPDAVVEIDEAPPDDDERIS